MKVKSQSRKIALAIFAHPDDIEFRAAGTLLRLGAVGYQLHYWNLSSGNLGSTFTGPKQTAKTRSLEARVAAQKLGATFHAPIGNDLELFYEDQAIRLVCAVIREVQPTILLTHPPQDYMEDHMITCRLSVTGAFARNIPNYTSRPKRQATSQPMAIYHSMPHGLNGPLREEVVVDHWVDTSLVHKQKRAALACHRSQKEWLDASQGIDSYLSALDEEAQELGRRSGRFTHAEGWRRHLHLGFGPPNFNPLQDVL